MKTVTPEILAREIEVAQRIARESGEDCYLHRDKVGGVMLSDEYSDSPFMIGVKAALLIMGHGHLNIVGVVSPAGEVFFSDLDLTLMAPGSEECNLVVRMLLQGSETLV